MIIPPPPPHIPSPTVGLDLHTEYGIEKQHQVLNNDFCTALDDCNAGKLNVTDDVHRSNEKSIAASIGGHSIVNNTRSQYDKVSSSDSVSDRVIVADYTPVTLRRNCIFDNKKLLQYHFHHDAMSKHYQFKVKRSNSTLLHVICIDNEGCPWQLRATRMRGSEFFVVKRFDDVHTCSIEIVQGHHRQAKSWMIGEAWRGKEAALTSLRGDDAESYKANLVHPDAAFGICVQHLAANLKTRYKDFKGPLKTYFDGASRSYLLSLTVTPRPADQFEYAVTNNAAKIWIFDISERTCTCKRFQVDQIPCPHAMAVCNHRRINPYNYCSNYYTKDYLYACYAHVVHPIGSAEGWDVSEEIRLQIVNPPTTKRGPGRPRVRRIPSQGEEHEPNRRARAENAAGMLQHFLQQAVAKADKECQLAFLQQEEYSSYPRALGCTENRGSHRGERKEAEKKMHHYWARERESSAEVLASIFTPILENELRRRRMKDEKDHL
ncbi:hypothetical protein TIFTF001_036863 [Ficus carica]|uniref:SWIM-type domain-containing protein n=1 Tax=Ficus carica TaxID=3494 RepID=A0AA88J888_FICCA|nr:hypothetical protein TIFTF001_036863 [Ficus carica]